MKKFTLVFFMILAVAGISKAQVIEDFESIGMNIMTGGAEDLSYFLVVANPDRTDANNSWMVTKFVRDKDGVPWGGFWAPLSVPIDVTTNKYVHVKVWKPRISPVKCKLEGGSSPNIEIASMNPQTVENGWQELVFDFSSTTGTYNTLVFMPDFNDPVALTEDITIYFDDFYVNNNPAVGSPAVQLVEDYEHIALNYMNGGAEDQMSMTLILNPDRSGINTSYYVIQFLRDKDGVPWGGFWSSLQTQVDVTTNKYVHVKVWKPRISPIKFKLEGGGAGNLETPSMNQQVVTGAWQDMVFDFTSKTGTYPVIAFMPDFEDPLTLTEDIMIYFDDILVNNDPNPMIPDNQMISVNMKGSRLAAGEKVYISGDFGGIYGTWAEPGSNATNEMTDPNADSIYSIALDIADGTYHFKFFKGSGWNGGEWTGDPNRILTTKLFTPVTYIWGDKSSGIEDIPFTQQVNVYPVPFSNSLTISSLDNIKMVTITSSYGQQVARFDNPVPGATTINTSQLASGMYFVTFFGKNGQLTTKKIIKTND